MAKNTGRGSRHAAAYQKSFEDAKKFGGAFERNPYFNDQWIERNGKVVRRGPLSRLWKWIRCV